MWIDYQTKIELKTKKGNFQFDENRLNNRHNWLVWVINELKKFKTHTIVDVFWSNLELKM